MLHLFQLKRNKHRHSLLEHLLQKIWATWCFREEITEQLHWGWFVWLPRWCHSGCLKPMILQSSWLVGMGLSPSRAQYDIKLLFHQLYSWKLIHKVCTSEDMDYDWGRVWKYWIHDDNCSIVRLVIKINVHVCLGNNS